MAKFEFDQLRRITRDAAEGFAPRVGGAPDAPRPDRERFAAALDDDAWDSWIEELRRWQDCRAWSPRPSHRPGIGGLVTFAKRVFFRLMRPALREAFETQARFNECAVELIARLAEERRALRAELARLRGNE